MLSNRFVAVSKSENHLFTPVTQIRCVLDYHGLLSFDLMGMSSKKCHSSLGWRTPQRWRGSDIVFPPFNLEFCIRCSNNQDPKKRIEFIRFIDRHIFNHGQAVRHQPSSSFGFDKFSIEVLLSTRPPPLALLPWAIKKSKEKTWHPLRSGQLEFIRKEAVNTSSP